VKLGYFLSSEEWGPKDLVNQAVKAQQAGFDRLWISDHFHDACFAVYRDQVLSRF
jgi:alkanesulfonate monooxygenase SsuD/methylene tetrahydromethanopterin reductase-like flavin-dependent oxidoreductase (luciferase family)